jgi:hypothetical protein
LIDARPSPEPLGDFALVGIHRVTREKGFRVADDVFDVFAVFAAAKESRAGTTAPSGRRHKGEGLNDF